MLEPYRKVLIVGCDGCAGIYEAGGLRQANLLKKRLEMASDLRKSKVSIEAMTLPRQCDKDIVGKELRKAAVEKELILSLGCGAGVQTIAEVYADIQVVPALNTKFIGIEDKAEAKLLERCRACGDCMLAETGGICPITRCPKGLLNGPCGGFVKGKCEVGERKHDCAWILIFNRLKEMNRLDLFLKLRPPKDYRVWESPRELDIANIIIGQGPSKPAIETFAPPKSKEIHSELMKRIAEHKFVVTGEVEPIKTTGLTEVLESAKRYKGYAVAVNVTDNPTAFAYMNALIPSYFIQKEVGLEAVYQMVTRDRNRLILTSDLLSAGALGIKNVLALTGDFVTFGDNPQAKPVWDIDSAQLTYMIRRMVSEGVDLAGKKILNPPKFHVGVAGNPNADPLEPEVYKLLRKQEAGADFIQTQSTYDIEIAEKFMDLADSIGVKLPILIGVTPFKNIPMMDYLVKFVPGIIIPEEIQDRLRKAAQISKEKFVEENVEIFSELCKEIRGTRAAGIHMMPIGFEWVAPPILERAGIKI